MNVGGQRVFRPAELPGRLPRLGLVNIGAAGTFVARATISASALRAALVRALPFEAQIILCDGRDILRLVRSDPFAAERLPAGTVRFVTVLGEAPDVEPFLPLEFRDGRRWLIRLVGRSGPFVLGAYRRTPKTAGYLPRVDRLFDVPVTTRNWNTITTIAETLDAGDA